MRTILQAIEILDNIPQPSSSFFSFGADKTKGLKKLLLEFDLHKYVPESDDNTRSTIVNKLLAKIKSQLEKNKKNSDYCNALLKVRNIINENLEYYSPENLHVYWQGVNQPISSKPPGIAILCNDPRKKYSHTDSGDFPLDFKEKVIQNLNYIAQTPAGAELLQKILHEVQSNPDNPISIVPAPFKQGNRAIPLNIERSMEKSACELATGKIGPNVFQTFKLISQAYPTEDPYEWLAARINELPLYSLDNPPIKFTDIHKPFLAKDLKAWFDTGNQGYTFLMQNYDAKTISQLICATIAVLHPFAEPGQGSGTVVRWNAFAENKFNQKRPAAIGLAHELIHAYYNAKGIEPGKEQDDTTALLEFLAVGLGQWEHNDFSENAIRAQWQKILHLIPNDDDLGNQQIPTLRTQYNDVVSHNTSQPAEEMTNNNVQTPLKTG